MEHTLRCNSLKCRKELSEHAVVTTCSHIFCLECSSQLGLSGQRGDRRPICPACEAQLPNPDDVVVTNLNPTEDYKTSVLSGLSPQVIMECAGRGLSFWAYQTTQEIVYHEYLARSLSDKYTTLNSQLDKIIHDANSEISNLRNKISTLQIDQEQAKRKNDELNQALRDKTRKHLQTQELYDKLKRRSMLGHVQNAAQEAVDESIQASVSANRYTDVVGEQNMHPPPPPLFPNQQSNVNQQTSGSNVAQRMAPPHASLRGDVQNGWGGFGNAQSSLHQPVQTPSTHRQRLQSAGNSFHHGTNVGIGASQLSADAPPSQPRSASRQPLAHITPNAAPPGFAGYGMSAGLRVSNPTGSVVNSMRPINRSRVAQRPASGFAGYPVPKFTTSTPVANVFSNHNIY